jgi:deoxycytidylate deaminase
MTQSTPQAGPRAPELFFGLAGAVGANLELVEQTLASKLGEVGYQTTPVRFSDLLHNFVRWQHLESVTFEDERIEKHMAAGRRLRELFGRGDALALTAVAKLQRVVRRADLGLPANTPAQRRAYVFRSLKHPAELRLLREVFGSAFFLIGGYSPKSHRVKRLTQRFADSRGSLRPSDYEARALELVRIDEEETGAPLGQNVRKVFPEADVFVNAAEPESLRKSVRRFVELLFGYPYHTPTRDESNMFHAYAAALRSASMARQVGAVVADADGEILATGCNEVPKSGGGFYWPDDEGDKRDFQLGVDVSDTVRLKNLGQVLNVLAENGWLDSGHASEDARTRLTNAKALLKSSQVMSAIEYVRAVHAEMAAIVGAARRGAPLRGSTLYTTTFPCHDCAKHIVGVGVNRVVYIEPYPKSLAEEMHSDSLVVDETRKHPDRVAFQPFVGVAPRLYPALFTAGTRKRDDGTVVDWSQTKTTALPRIAESESETPLYLIRETKQVGHLDALVEKHTEILSTPDIG